MSSQLPGKRAALGAVAFLIQPLLLTSRSAHLTHALTFVNIADLPLGTLTAFGHQIAIGTCAVTGIGLTGAQMLSASVVKVESETGGDRTMRMLAVIGYILLSALDLTASVLCASGWGAAENFAVTLALLVVETLCGIMMLDGLFVPAWLGTAGAIRHIFRRRR